MIATPSYTLWPWWCGVLCVAAFMLWRKQRKYSKRQLKVLDAAMWRLEEKAPHLVAVVTGANGGIGEELVRNLLKAGVTVFMCCRNATTGAIVRQHCTSYAVRKDQLQFIQLDLASPASVARAVDDIKDRTSHIDVLYMNAGVLPFTTYRWAEIVKAVLHCRLQHFMDTGRCRAQDHMFVETHTGLHTQSGVGLFFAVHVLGHYHMVRELLPLLEAAPSGRVIWTGSRCATSSGFSWSDVEAVNTTDAYGVTKYEIDLLSHGLNQQWLEAQSTVRSYVCCPGITVTPISPAILWLSRFVLSATRWIHGCPIHPVYAIVLHVFLATANEDDYPCLHKWVLQGTHIVPALDGAPAVNSEEAARLVQYCDSKLTGLLAQ